MKHNFLWHLCFHKFVIIINGQSFQNSTVIPRFHDKYSYTSNRNGGLMRMSIFIVMVVGVLGIAGFLACDLNFDT